MTLQEYIRSCEMFARDSADWGGLDEYKHYVALPGGGWTESADNAEGGIDVSWAFGLPAGRINPALAEDYYREAFSAEYAQGQDEGWDAAQMDALADKYEACVVNASGHVFVDQEDALVAIMDPEIREKLEQALAPCTFQQFFSAYEAAHEEKFGEPWELSRANPVW